MTKTITIDGKSVTFRATAAIPRLYRIKFGRDIMRDMRKIKAAMDENENDIPVAMLETFENMAYLFAKHADPEGVPSSVEEWLDGFNTFSIYQVLPQVIELWGLNVQTDVESKKNFVQQSVR